MISSGKSARTPQVKGSKDFHSAEWQPPGLDRKDPDNLFKVLKFVFVYSYEVMTFDLCVPPPPPSFWYQNDEGGGMEQE